MELVQTTETEIKVLNDYRKPTLIKLGTVADLTTGGSGPAGDVTNPADPRK